MSTLAIVFNDAGIAMALGASLLPESPACALLDGKRLVLGDDARRRARLQPRQIHDRFWDQLGANPLPLPSPLARTTADLAFAHLSQLWDAVRDACDAVLLAVPASLDRQQLGVLLGIAQALGMPVVGMVDSAVAASTRAPIASAGGSAQRIIHLDVHLHRTVATHLDAGAALTRVGVESNTQLGVASLHNLWAQAIAEFFVRSTRFDPLHDAESEQQLYDLLPDAIARLRKSDRVAVEIASDGRAYRVTVPRTALVQAAGSAYQRMTVLLESAAPSGMPLVIHLSARAAGLPGLVDCLAALDVADLMILEPGAAAFGALAAESEIGAPDAPTQLATSLPLRERDTTHSERVERTEAPPERDSARAEVDAVQTPSHLLCGAVATPIEIEPLRVWFDSSTGAWKVERSGKANSFDGCVIARKGREVWVEVTGAARVLVSDMPVDRRVAVGVGDSLRIEGVDERLQLILVESSSAERGH